MRGIRRREFITLIGSLAAAWPFAARAQQSGKLRIIGFLGASTAPAFSQWTGPFVQRLRELGWIEVAPSRSSIAGRRGEASATPRSPLSSSA
jgi:hypothetical protein